MHDIGLTVVQTPEGEIGFRVMVGGGLGRTPILGSVIREFLPWQHVMTYIEAIMRVYNQYGRRDNKYKARIKILLKAVGAEEFARLVEAEWADLKDSPSTLTAEELQRVAAYFTPHVVPDAARGGCRFRGAQGRQQGLRQLAQAQRQAAQGARLRDCRAVAQKDRRCRRATAPPSRWISWPTWPTATASANCASRTSRTWCWRTSSNRHLFEVWQKAKAQGLATPNIGLLTDIICCPGGDFCSLANAKSIPIAQAIAQRFDDLDYPARHRRHRAEHLGLHQRLRPSPHRQHRRAGRRQGRQRVVPGLDRRRARRQQQRSARSSARRSRRQQMPEVIDRLLAGLSARARSRASVSSTPRAASASRRSRNSCMPRRSQAAEFAEEDAYA